MWLKSLDYRHYLNLIVSIAFVLLAAFVFRSALIRFGEATRDVGVSIANYFMTLFGIEHNFGVSVISPSVAPYPIVQNFENFKICFVNFWKLFGSLNNFKAYLLVVFKILLVFVMFSAVFVFIAVIVFVLLRKFLYKENNDYGAESKPLRIVKRIAMCVYHPAKTWLCAYIGFIREHAYWWKIWLAMWLVMLNVVTIALATIAYLLYISVSFDFGSIFYQLYKLMLDLSLVFDNLPVVFWVVIVIIVFDRLRKHIGYSRLQHMEMRNRGFVNERPIVYMIVGTMGKRKTTLLTDIALSQEVMFRDKAYELMLLNDLKFPYFPWINLENELCRAMKYHCVFNLATVKRWIRLKRSRWEKCPTEARIFGYDSKRYGISYDDKLYESYIWDVLETYAQLFFIYIMQSSLIVSNYSIRTDLLINSLGNFPIWYSDFFKSDSRLLGAHSRHAHIADMDLFRLGKKVLENNPRSDSFEFGVVTLTEIGKERGNQIENRGKKKTDDETNQLNDLFNVWLKMARHSATVDNFPFISVITDEQRPESWGADARDLCEIIHIGDSTDIKLAMPFFNIEDVLYNWFFDKFRKVYLQYRYKRGDNTLMMHALKTFMKCLYDHYTRIYNIFGYRQIDLSVEAGIQDGNMQSRKYYLMSKKIYSKRFSTDCFADFFNEKALRSRLGLNDLKEFATERASFEEMLSENSYFFNDLVRIRDGENK